jgi:hypothetical protein
MKKDDILREINRLSKKIALNKLYGTNLCREILLPMNPAPKYKFSRANWWVANFDPEYYFEVEEWCKKNFGPHPRYPDAWSRWVHTYEDQIHFRDEQDYIFFLLRWSV